MNKMSLMALQNYDINLLRDDTILKILSNIDSS